MKLLRLATAILLAGFALMALAVSASAATPAGPLTIALTCDTGKSGSGTFVVTANGKSSAVSVKCGGSASVSNAAWMAGSAATIHQTAAPPGALRAFNRSVVLKATAQTVAIRNFRPVASSNVATLAQTGGGVPWAPIGMVLGGLLLVGFGGRLVLNRRA